MMKKQCELCGGAAALYCEPDDAFLCWTCDASVHGANFLVARHVRRVACGVCHAVDAGRCVSGTGSPPLRAFCRSCDPRPRSPPAEPSSPASSSSCVSAAESTTASDRPPAKRRRAFSDARWERVLARWSRKMGLRSGRRCVAAAASVIGACEVAVRALPVRVALAAALWFAIKLFAEEEKGDDMARRGVATALRRLEACSGVPASLIAVTESRLARAPARR